MKTYLIHFKIINLDNSITEKKCKIHKSLTGVEAQCKLEKYLKSTMPTFQKLIVISCVEEVKNPFEDLLKGSSDFSKIFGNFK